MGYLSPDIDLWIDGKGNLAHRRGTHYWWWLLLVGGLGLGLVLAVQPLLWWTWLAWVTGWFVHILGDATFGKQVPGTDGAGVPMAGPAKGYASLTGGRLSSGGIVEKITTWTVLVPALVVAFGAWSGLSWGGTFVIVVLWALVGLAADRPKRRR